MAVYKKKASKKKKITEEAVDQEQVLVEAPVDSDYEVSTPDAYKDTKKQLFG